jgi:hypothetical protein
MKAKNYRQEWQMDDADAERMVNNNNSVSERERAASLLFTPGRTLTQSPSASADEKSRLQSGFCNMHPRIADHRANTRTASMNFDR